MADLGRIDQYLQGIFSGLRSGDIPASGIRLNEMEVHRLNDLLGIRRCGAEFLEVGATQDTVGQWLAKAAALARESGRVVLKVVGRDILHKTEIGGVKVVDLTNTVDPQAALREELDELRSSLLGANPAHPVEGFLAGAFVPHRPNQPGQEILLSLKQDPAFGPCIVLGIGGTLTEWYGSAGSSTVIFPAAGLTAAMVESALTAHPLLAILSQPSRLYETGPSGLVNWWKRFWPWPKSDCIAARPVSRNGPSRSSKSIPPWRPPPA